MNLKTFVKVGSITNLSDARFCAGFGVDLLGFDINSESENYISIDKANEIMGWVAGPEFVAEFGNMAVDDIIKLQEENKFPFVQVDQLNTARTLHAKGYRIILNAIIKDNNDLSLLSEALAENSKFAYIIVNCTSPQLIPSIEELLNNPPTLPIIKAYDVELSQLDHIIQIQPYSGIELKGSQEDKPGFKEYDELADILEALEVED